MKRAMAIVFAALLALGLWVQPAAAQTVPVKVHVNGLRVPLTPAPVVKNGVTYVPFRAVAELLGKTVQWHQETQTVVVGKMPNDLAKGSGVSLVVDGRKIDQAAPYLEEGRTWVPLRALSEALGAKVTYQSRTRTVLIDLPGLPRFTQPTSPEGELLWFALQDLSGDGVPEAVLAYRQESEEYNPFTPYEYRFEVLQNKGSFWGPVHIWNHDVDGPGQQGKAPDEWRPLNQFSLQFIRFDAEKPPLLWLQAAKDGEMNSLGHQFFFWNAGDLSAVRWGGQGGAYRAFGSVTLPGDGTVVRKFRGLAGREVTYRYKYDGGRHFIEQ